MCAYYFIYLEIILIEYPSPSMSMFLSHSDSLPTNSMRHYTIHFIQRTYLTPGTLRAVVINTVAVVYQYRARILKSIFRYDSVSLRVYTTFPTVFKNPQSYSILQDSK